MLGRRVLAALFVAALAFGPPALALRHTGTVVLRCAVVGATVSVDGELVGTVPVDPFEVHVGVHTLRVVRAGLIAFQEQLRVYPGKELTVVAVAKEERSLLSIHTTEKGGEVLLDGERVGELPLDSHPILPGAHSLFIRHDGLRPYQEKFTVAPFREYVSTPTLRRRDGSIAAGPTVGLGLGLDLAPAKAAPQADDLDLDLSLAPAPAPKKNAPQAVAANDLDLDLPLAPAAAPAPPAPAATRPPTPNPAPRPAPPNLAARPAEPPTPTFVAAAIPKPAARVEASDEDEEDSTPFFQQKWVWATAALAAVAAVAVPVAMGKTGGYREVRDPTAICGDCLVVMNK